MRMTVCILCYGDHADLARRCLESISGILPYGQEIVRDIRIGLNACGAETTAYVAQWSKETADKFDVAVHLLSTPENRYKYPFMRKMFYGEQLAAPAEWVMWLDDDSCFSPEAIKNGGEEWWKHLTKHMPYGDMIGEHWLMPVQGNQLEWIKMQPWCNPDAGPPPKHARGSPCFEFCQGAWWVARFDVLSDLNWPVPEIRHNGGDSMLGEALRHAGKKMIRFRHGVHINAGDDRKNSSSKRRGHSEKRVGWDYSIGKTYDLSFQEFSYKVESFDSSRKLLRLK